MDSENREKLSLQNNRGRIKRYMDSDKLGDFSISKRAFAALAWQTEDEDVDEHEHISSELGVTTFDEAKMEISSVDEIKIGGKKLNNRFLQGNIKAKEENHKLTIYIDKSLMATIKALKKNNVIDSYSNLINEALIDYLTES